MQTTFSNIRPGRWLHWFAIATAVATLGLIGIGGLVTSHGVGMAVPDWPTSYGYNMFALPIEFWQGGIFYEHTHRLWASAVGLMVVALTRWLGGAPSRLPLAIVGAFEIVAGFAILFLWPDLKGAGHFLTGIGGVVLAAAVVWVKNRPARFSLVVMGWIAFGLVQLQGLLGGLRVVLSQNEIGIFHGALAQLFFVLVCIIAMLTGARWTLADGWRTSLLRPMNTIAWAVTSIIFIQLVLGATMRHQHAGLAIPDFPLAYGKLWPATDPDSILHYNQRRIEASAVDPIEASHVILQMVHRIVAIAILAGIVLFVWTAKRRLGASHRVTRLGVVWLGMILFQVVLGAATIWSRKAADIATAHVLMGALSLAMGTALGILCVRNPEATTATAFSASEDRGSGEAALLRGHAASQS